MLGRNPLLSLGNSLLQNCSNSLSLLYVKPFAMTPFCSSLMQLFFAFSSWLVETNLTAYPSRLLQNASALSIL